MNDILETPSFSRFRFTRGIKGTPARLIVYSSRSRFFLPPPPQRSFSFPFKFLPRSNKFDAGVLRIYRSVCSPLNFSRPSSFDLRMLVSFVSSWIVWFRPSKTKEVELMLKN